MSAPAGSAPATESGWVDPRDQVEFSVLLASGRLAGRRFASREEAEAWAGPEEEVVSFNPLCDCEM